MALKKPSDFFLKKVEDNNLSVSDTDDSLRQELNKVESLSGQLQQLQQELTQKVVKNDLESIVLSQINLMQKNFESLQKEFKESNKNDLNKFKKVISEVTKTVKHLVENDIPKHKKEILSNEVRLGNQLKEFKEEVEDNIQQFYQVLNEFNDVVQVIDTVSNIEKYLQEHHQDLIALREEVFAEIGQIPVGNLQENLERLEKKIDLIRETYSKIDSESVAKEIIQEGLLNQPPETKNQDSLTPLDQNFVTIDQFQEHYRLFVNRIQQQLSTLGGGGETQLKYLDDIVGITTNASAYSGKFLKYDHSLGKFIFEQVDYSATAGIATYATSAGIATYATSAGIATYATAAGIATYATSAGIATYATSAGIATYATAAGIATYATAAGIATVAQNLTGTPNINIGFTTITGVGNTALVVNGDVRITGILTIGTSTLTLDGTNNNIQIGTGVTITESGSASYSGIITATNFVGVGSELSFTQVGVGATSITFGSKLSEFVSVRDFGAVGDGITDDTAAIESTFSAFSGSNKKIYFPAGVYRLTSTLVIGSNTTVLGDGPGITTITMPNNVSRNYAVVNIGTATTQSTNIHFEGITVDFNINRWSQIGSAGPFASYDGLQKNCITIANSKHVTIRDCRFIDGYRHCLDINCPSISGGGKNTSGTEQQKYLQMPVYPSTLAGQYIKIDNCYFRGGGDDNLTTHYCSDVYITGCHSEYPRGGFGDVGDVGNSNGFEVDDGSRNITITNCLAVGCKSGIEIKAHYYAPAPYNIVVDTVRIINCVSSFEAHHGGWIGPSNDADSAYQVLGLNGNTPVELASGTSYQIDTFEGLSPMAKNLSISNLQIIAPCSQTFRVKTSNTTWTTTTSQAYRVFELGGYSNVIVNNLQISDGSSDPQLSADGYNPAESLQLGMLIHLHDNVRNFSFYNTSIFGCEDIANYAFRVNNIMDEFVINGLISRKGPAQIIYGEGSSSSDYSGLIDNVVINNGYEGGASPGSEAVGAAISLNNSKVQIGKVLVNGITPYSDVSSDSSRVITGSGSPEGVYYAGKGSLYLRNDATNSSTALYVKTTTKNLNTGWVAK